MGRTGQSKENLIEAMRDLIWVGSYAGTSVDEICNRAAVHKGSFYHYFRSKSDLVIAAMESCWSEYRVEMDRLFSPTKPPVQRLVDWLVYLREDQHALQKEHGRVLGCPIHTIGSELGGNQDALHDLLKGMLRDYVSYLESALREIAPETSAATARLVFFYVEGLLTHARIWNDLSELDQMEDGVRQLLGHPELWPTTSPLSA